MDLCVNRQGEAIVCQFGRLTVRAFLTMNPRLIADRPRRRVTRDALGLLPRRPGRAVPCEGIGAS
jgi:hypothetical protein